MFLFCFSTDIGWVESRVENGKRQSLPNLFLTNVLIFFISHNNLRKTIRGKVM